MEILVHMCCGPCASVFTDGMAAEGHSLHLLWHNPNIHPFKEYESRKKAAMDFAAQKGLYLSSANAKYGLRDFLSRVTGDMENRCRICYYMRLEYTAEQAANLCIKAFTTTLLASPYQNFDMICELGKQIAKKIGPKFIVRDFRAFYRPGLAKARDMGLFMQKYCGCIFSEEERYQP